VDEAAERVASPDSQIRRIRVGFDRWPRLEPVRWPQVKGAVGVGAEYSIHGLSR